MKRDFRCWVTDDESCDWNCDSNPQPWANVIWSATNANAPRATNQSGVVEMDSEALVDLIITDLSKRSMIGRAIEQVNEERGKYWLRNEVKKMVKEVTK